MRNRFETGGDRKWAAAWVAAWPAPPWAQRASARPPGRAPGVPAINRFLIRGCSGGRDGRGVLAHDPRLDRDVRSICCRPSWPTITPGASASWSRRASAAALTIQHHHDPRDRPGRGSDYCALEYVEGLTIQACSRRGGCRAPSS